jgi:sugar phosphate permease
VQRSIIAPAERVTNLRWAISVVLGAGILVAYLDRVSVTVAGPAMVRELGLSDSVLGVLLGTFAWAYALAQVPLAVVVDRFGVTAVGRAAALAGTALTLLTAAATGGTGLLATRLGAALAQTPAFPLAAKATGYWFPVSERSRATAIFDASGKLAIGIGVPLMGTLLVHYGWRATFLLAGALAFAYFIAFAVFYRDPDAHKQLTFAERKHLAEGGAQPEVRPSPATLVGLLRQPTMWGLTVGFAAYGYAFSLLLLWLPAYVGRSLTMNATESSAYVALPWIVAGLVELIVGGFVLDRLIARGGEQHVRTVTLAVGMLLGLAVLGAATTSNATAAIAWITLGLSGLAIVAPIAWSLPALIAPAGTVATIGGIAACASNVMAIVAPIAATYLVAMTGNFAAAFVSAAIALGVGLFGYAFVLGIAPLGDESIRPRSS